MRLFVVMFLCFIGFALSQSQPLSPTAREALRQGNKTVIEALLKDSRPFIDQPLWREAIAYGLTAKDAAPTRPEPYGYLGKVYSYVKFYDAAWDAYSSFHAFGGIPDERQRQGIVELGRTLGYEFFAKGDFEKALEVYLVAYHYALGDQEITLQIARSYLGNNQADLALVYLRQLDARHLGDYSRYLETANDQLEYSQSASAAYERGIELYYLGKLAEAQAAFAEAARLEPTFQKAHVWAGRTSLELSQPETALPHWQQALALQPNSVDMQYFLTLTQNQVRWGVSAYNAFEQGMTLYTQGRMPEARVSLGQAVTANPNFSEAWAWLGRIAYEGADYQTAYKTFGRAKDLADNENYHYFYEASAQHLGLNTVMTHAVATLEQAAPVMEVKKLETITKSPTVEQPFVEQPDVENEGAEIPVTKNPAPEITLAESLPIEMPVKVNMIETVPDLPNPFRSDLGARSVTDDALTVNHPSTEPLVLLDTTYTYERSDIEGSGAVSFFAASEETRHSWQGPTNYAEGVVYQRLEVFRKPSEAIVAYQLCLVPNDDISVKPTCSRATGLEFSEVGTYEFQQPLSEFYQYDNIDWGKGISNIMVILRDEDGNPIDTAFSHERDVSLDLYYPIEVRYSVVLVPERGSFRGWP
jgi:tetratricopeptide (TPR) repeat protein